MNFQQLYSDKLTIELASQDQNQLFTTARRKAAVNEAVGAFVRLTDCSTRVGSVPIVDGTGEYDLEAALTDFIRLHGDPSIKIVKAGVPDRYIQGRDLTMRDTEQLDYDDNGWRSASAGTPMHYYIENNGGATNLGFYPPPDVGAGETWTIRIPYVALPPDMVDNTDEPFAFSANSPIRLRPYHQALAHYAAAVLEPLRKNFTAVQRQMSLFNGYVAMYLQDERTAGPDQITLERDYYSEGLRSPQAVDPRRYP